MKDLMIVAIHGQIHKGNTYFAYQNLVNNLPNNTKIKEYFMPKDLPHHCLGCFSCVKNKEKCPFNSEKQAILDEIIKADILIFTSPNYCMMPTSGLAAFFDLFFTNWLIHKPIKEMFSKKAIVITTTAGMGAKNVAKKIRDNLSYWGVPYIKICPFIVRSSTPKTMSTKVKNKISKEMAKLANKLSKMRPVRITLKMRITFNISRYLVKTNRGASLEEKQYWISQGWLGKNRPWKK